MAAAMHQPVCACERPLCPAEGGGFYVTVVDGPRVGFLLGPYDAHEEALANVARGRALANDADPRAAFYGFGTVRRTDGRVLPTVFGK